MTDEQRSQTGWIGVQTGAFIPGRRLNIVHVLSSFGMGGQERVALDLARAQQRAGHRVTAVSIAGEPDGPLAAEFAASDVAVRRVPKLGPSLDPTLTLRLVALLVRGRADVVHTHNPQPLVYAAPAARLAWAVSVHTKHGANPYRGRKLLLRRASARFVHAYVAVSEVTATVAREHREVAEGKLRVITNGIDLSRFEADADARAAVRRELGIPADAWVVGTVGRLAPEKDQALLVRAMAPLVGPGVRLVIVGDGAEAAALRALADPRFVHLPGARRDVPRLLAAMDVFCLSSKSEGLPLVIPEAMASRLPVVATAVGGVPAVVDEGRTGFLVPAGDEGALRDRLERLANDRALAAAFGARARETALARYSLDRMADDYMSVYREALGR